MLWESYVCVCVCVCVHDIGHHYDYCMTLYLWCCIMDRCHLSVRLS